MRVKIDKALQGKVEKVVERSSSSWKKEKLQQDETDPCIYQSPHLNVAKDPFQKVQVRIYLKDSIVVNSDEEEEQSSKLELEHALWLKVGKTHKTHHTAVVNLTALNTKKQSAEKMSPEEEQEENDASKIAPPLWCISYEQLMGVEQTVLQKCGPGGYSTMTMRDICREIIEPLR